jgi:hypothetical protein
MDDAAPHVAGVAATGREAILEPHDAYTGVASGPRFGGTGRPMNPRLRLLVCTDPSWRWA